jgi:hypothetical protein
MFVKGQKVGKLKIILKKEDIIIRQLHDEMIKQCKQLRIRPVTRSMLSSIGFGDNPDHRVSTYLKILNALNSLKRREEPYTLYDLIEPDEILQPIKK